MGGVGGGGGGGSTSGGSTMETLFGQVAKTVVYGGATVIRMNNRILCPLFSRETERDNDDQPTLFAFNKKLNPEHAFRIYADDEVNPQMIKEAQFDPTQMTFVFVHGWLGGIHNEIWLSAAKNAALRGSVPYSERYLQSNNNTASNSFSRHSTATPAASAATHQLRESTTSENTTSSLMPKASSSTSSSTPATNLFKPNVIIVDWSEFAKGSLFAATENSFKVSRRLGRLLEQLANVGKLRPELMHCFGHSIGAHICGQAARHAFPVQPRPAGSATTFSGAQKRMGRISALDPGGFCYELGVKNETNYLGLRPSDALLVDAYHSNRSPFGNRFQVAHYNVRINNGIFQRPCSVWLNPDVAGDYFRAAVRFSLGNVGHNDILTCDHYFATRFAAQLLTPTCSFVAYACDSYRNFLRGRCGSCKSPTQCYTMDFEYQRPNASTANALTHINKHSSYFNDFTTSDDDDELDVADFNPQPLGGVPYAKRLTYYMRITDEEPYCSEC